jgi:hypothetical protein
MSKTKLDLKSDDATKPMPRAGQSALAECAMVIASTLLLRCKTRGQLDARERELEVINSRAKGRSPERNEARAQLAFAPVDSD